jgi:HPt (histidine-containing phosphotransfer) domain-containing protein
MSAKERGNISPLEGGGLIKTGDDGLPAFLPPTLAEREYHHLPLIDTQHLDEIFEVLTAEDLAELFDTFLTSALKTLEELAAVGEEKLFEEIRAKAHFLKGGAANIAAARLAGLAKSVEIEAKKAIWNPEVIGEFWQILGQTTQAMEKLVATMPR